MRTINIIISVIFLSLFICCNLDNCDKKYFNGEIQYFDENSVITRDVNSKILTLNGNNTGMIAVYDSLLICWNPGYQNHFFKIFNVDTGDEIGSFCNKGRGDNEVISVGCIAQLFKKGDDIMPLLYASNEGKLFLWNISQSIEKNTTVYDTIVPYNNDRIFFEFYQSDNILFAYKPAEYLNTNEATTPYYEKRTISTNELMQDYPIYKTKSVQNNDVNERNPVNLFFYTWDVMNPNGSKIVQVMKYLPQINILDVSTGNLTGYRMKNSPDFSLLESSMESMDVYYNCVHADENYIYAAYWGREAWDDRLGVELPKFNIIHVFDWNGKLLYKLTTDRSFYRVWLDPVRKLLYTINLNNDEVYYLDLEDLSLDKINPIF